MKLIVSVLLSGSCLLLSSGCDREPAGAAPAEREVDRDHSAAGVALELNDGKKWEADEHTRSSIDRMAALIDGAEPLDSVKDARALGTAFDTELQSLIQGCTMTGPAHDQLHVFLAALFPKVRDLKTGTDPEELRAAHREIRLLLDAFERHFR